MSDRHPKRPADIAVPWESANSQGHPTRPPLAPEVVDVFNTVRDLPDHERRDTLDRLTRGDVTLRTAVQRLLDAERSPIGERVGRILDDALVDIDDALTFPTSAHRGALPQIDDRYTIVRLLGSGSTGDVYLADQIQPVQRRVAIKVLRPAEVRASTVERMRREAVALSALDHPGIASIYDAGVTRDNRPFLVTQWIDGPPIDQWCQENNASYAVRCRLIAAVCSAVEHAHQRGIIHRDLKPGNILVRGHASQASVRIVDLGIAKLAEDEHGWHGAPTDTGKLLGTIGFIAPEQISGGVTDVRSDLFAIGRVLETLLAAVPAGAALPRRRDVQAIVARATASEPADRYQSAGAMAADLKAALHGRPVSARRRSLPDSVGRFVRRSPLAAVVVLVSAVAVCIAGGVAVERSFAQSHALRERARVLALQKALLHETLDGSIVILGRYAGTIDQRMQMADRLDAQLRAMLSWNPDDHELRILLARVGTERARIALARDEGYRAERLARDAVAAMKDQIDPNAASVDRVRQLALSIVVLGDCLANMKAYDRARDAYHEALELQRAARLRFPDHMGLLDDLSWSMDRFSQPVDPAMMPEFIRDRRSWNTIATARLELAEHMLRLDPDRYLSRFNLAVAYLKLGRIYAGDDDQKAAQYLHAASDMLQALAHEDPGRSAIHARLSSVWTLLAEYHGRRGDQEASLEAQEKAVLALIEAVGSRPDTDAGLAHNLRLQADRLVALYRQYGRDADIRSLRERLQRLAPSIADALFP